MALSPPCCGRGVIVVIPCGVPWFGDSAVPSWWHWGQGVPVPEMSPAHHHHHHHHHHHPPRARGVWHPRVTPSCPWHPRVTPSRPCHPNLRVPAQGPPNPSRGGGGGRSPPELRSPPKSAGVGSTRAPHRALPAWGGHRGDTATLWGHRSPLGTPPAPPFRGSPPRSRRGGVTKAKEEAWPCKKRAWPPTALTTRGGVALYAVGVATAAEGACPSSRLPWQPRGGRPKITRALCVRAASSAAASLRALTHGPAPLRAPPRAPAPRRCSHLSGRGGPGAPEGVERRQVLGLGRGRRAAARPRVVVPGEALEHGPGGAGAAPPRQGCGSRRYRHHGDLRGFAGSAGISGWKPGGARWEFCRKPRFGAMSSGVSDQAPGRRSERLFAARSAGASVPGSGSPVQRPGEPLQAPVNPCQAPVRLYEPRLAGTKRRCVRPRLRFSAISSGTSVPGSGPPLQNPAAPLNTPVHPPQAPVARYKIPPRPSWAPKLAGTKPPVRPRQAPVRRYEPRYIRPKLRFPDTKFRSAAASSCKSLPRLRHVRSEPR